MEKYQTAVIVALLCFSVAVLAVPATVFGIRKIILRMAGRMEKKLKVSRVLIFSAYLIASVWCLRYAVGYYSIITTAAGEETLAWWEEILNSAVHALQTFSMDEDYTDYIIKGKQMLIDVTGGETTWATLYGIYASVLNFVAPIAGGAILIELLSGIFPVIRLRLSYLAVWREKYFFSELNEASVALAKSIIATKKVTVVFADVCIDGDSGEKREFLSEAHRCGAICVSDDVSHIIKPRFGRCQFYLMDEDEFANLRELTELADVHNACALRNSSIYLFVESDAYVRIEMRVRSKLAEIIKEVGERPVIVPVNSYRNLVNNLLSDVPLYEPLINKTVPELNVTILGSGVIGTQAFLSIYWLGQMMVSRETDGKKTMDDCRLTVTVVSNEPEEEFRSKIDYINPEILSTVDAIGARPRVADGKLLEYDRLGNKNEPYCRVRYIRSDVKVGSFWSVDSGIINSDYFIVALGADSNNISIAEKLRCAVAKRHIESDEPVGRAVIAYAVFDSGLSETLNKEKCCKSTVNGGCDIYMYAFGSLKEVYSCENIYMSKNSLWARDVGEAYAEQHTGSDHLCEAGSRTNEDQDYKYWANLARVMHVKYKVFSLGWFGVSVFDGPDGESRAENQCRIYRKLAQGNAAVSPEDEEWRKKSEEWREKSEDIELKKHCLAWLEHRRWCAFTRTMGYRCTDVNKLMASTEGGAHKDMSLKVHSCLVEARRPALDGKDSYISADFNEHGEVTESSMFKEDDPTKRDRLDDVSWAKHKADPKAEDFKKYDYYRHEVGACDYENADSASEVMRVRM